jgi:hypothetical protein
MKFSAIPYFFLPDTRQLKTISEESSNFTNSEYIYISHFDFQLLCCFLHIFFDSRNTMINFKRHINFFFVYLFRNEGRAIFSDRAECAVQYGIISFRKNVDPIVITLVDRRPNKIKTCFFIEIVIYRPQIMFLLDNHNFFLSQLKTNR